MTTVAWDGKILAGDTLCSRGGLRTYVESKVFRIVSGYDVKLVGFSGDEQNCLWFKSWVEKGMPEDKRPEFVIDTTTALVIDATGCYRYEWRCRPTRILEPFHAIGYGRDLAIASMHYGHTAIEAVELAILYDTYTGGPVTSVRF